MERSIGPLAAKIDLFLAKLGVTDVVEPRKAFTRNDMEVMFDQILRGGNSERFIQHISSLIETNGNSYSLSENFE
jgi:hypothetical protein